MKEIDFESYLMEKHAEQYLGFKDNMVDDFSAWVQDLPVDTIIKYANEYAGKVHDELS